MPGWGPIGQFAVGELPVSGVTQAPFSATFLEPAKPIRRSVALVTSLNVLLYSSPFQQNWPPAKRVNPFVPSASRPLNLLQIANLGPFAKLDWGIAFRRQSSAPQAIPYNLNPTASLGPFTQSLIIPARTPSRIQPALAPNIVLLDLQSTPFAQLNWNISRKFRLERPAPSFLGLNLSLIPIPDTHDLVFIGDQFRKKKKRPDLIDEELARKAKLRADLELAIYGPPPVEPPQPAAAIPIALSPNVEDLAKIIVQMKTAELDAHRKALERDDEDVIDLILRDL